MASKLPFPPRRKRKSMKDLPSPLPIPIGNENSKLAAAEWPVYRGRLMDDYVLIEDEEQSALLYKNGCFGAFKSVMDELAYEMACGIGFDANNDCEPSQTESDNGENNDRTSVKSDPVEEMEVFSDKNNIKDDIDVSIAKNDSIKNDSPDLEILCVKNDLTDVEILPVENKSIVDVLLIKNNSTDVEILSVENESIADDILSIKNNSTDVEILSVENESIADDILSIKNNSTDVEILPVENKSTNVKIKNDSNDVEILSVKNQSADVEMLSVKNDTIDSEILSIKNDAVNAEILSIKNKPIKQAEILSNNSVSKTDDLNITTKTENHEDDTESNCESCIATEFSKIKVKGTEETKPPKYLRLDLEEALFLSYALGALVVSSNSIEMTIDLMWSKFCRIKKTFPLHYAVYHHFRINGWVVKNGLKFGGDFLLYPHGPDYYHGLHLVWVECLWKDTLQTDTSLSRRKFGLAEITALERLASHVAKNVLICQVLRPRSLADHDLLDIECLRSFQICESILRRFNPADTEQQLSKAS